MGMSTDLKAMLKAGLSPVEMASRAEEVANLLKTLSHPARLMIVCALVDGERSVRDLEDTLGIRQPGLSQQIAELREAGFIVGRKEAKHMFYRLEDGRVAEFVSMMHVMFCAKPREGSNP